MDEPTTKRKWTAEERRQLTAGEIDGGFAGPDQSYPIASAADVGDAWGLAGQAANPDQVRRRIIALARKFGWQSGLPDAARAWAEERGIPLKAGRRLSSRQLKRLAEAEQTIRDLVRWANYEDEEPPDEEAKSLLTVKALGNGRVGGYAALWGDPTRPDLTGEYFTRQTQEMDAIFKATGRLPLLYQHAMDGALATNVVGVVDTLTADDAGLWYEAQLTLATNFRRSVEDLIYKAALGTSSGTLPGARRVAADGTIERWPIVELSLTPTPAEPRMLARPVAEIKAAYAAAGLPAPAFDDEGPRASAHDSEPDAAPGTGNVQPAEPTPDTELALEQERVRLLALGG